MIQGLIVIMSVMILAYAAAWIFIPALRNLFEAPKDELLNNSERFVEKHLTQRKR